MVETLQTDTLSELRLMLSRGASLPGDWQVQLTAIQAEVASRLEINAASSDAWFRELSKILCEPEIPSAGLQRVDILISLAWYFEEAGDHEYGLRLTEFALKIAERADALSLKRRVLNSLGGLHNRGRNVAEATVALVQSLHLAEQLGDRLGRCAAIANIASVRLTMGMVDDAIKLSKLVLALCGNESLMSTLRGQAHHALAEGFLLLSDAQSARTHAQLALEHLPVARNQLDYGKHVMVEATLVRALIALGDCETARLHTAATLAHAANANAHTATVQSQLSLALCEASAGCTDIALSRLAAIEGSLSPFDISTRDFMEIELYSNKMAGRAKYAEYYNKKYLSSVSEFQRKTAIALVAELKQHLSHAGLGAQSGVRLTKRDRSRIFSEKMDELAALAEMREDATGEHASRVAFLSRILSLKLGSSNDEADLIEHAARLHDIGKLATPDAILLKRGRLSAAESQIIRRHTTEGCQILIDLLYTAEANQVVELVEVLRVAAEVAQNHHEWWDGSGYPRGISGSAIPRNSQIVALADVFDELTHARPYKQAYSKASALKVIESSAGRQFDPELCAKFIEAVRTFGEGQIQADSKISPFVEANRVIERIVSQSP